MLIEKAARRQVKLRLNISSPSGFGKTYGALLLAFGISEDWNKICVIDTENNSSSLYSHLGPFNVISLTPPFTPDRYRRAIQMAEEAGMEVIIIDSVTHIWKGQGGLLEYQNSLGGRYQDWAKATPLYQQWLNTILQSSCHVITTCRKKQAYNIITEGNKTKVEKAGLDDEIRDGYEYEMTLAIEITNDQHMVKASKDRTGLFTGKPAFIITPETGKLIAEWCNEGIPTIPEQSDFTKRIEACTDLKSLSRLYILHPEHQQTYHTHFTKRKKELLSEPVTGSDIITTQNYSLNGHSSI
jgi:hypothetical protein